MVPDKKRLYVPCFFEWYLVFQVQSCAVEHMASNVKKSEESIKAILGAELLQLCR